MVKKKLNFNEVFDELQATLNPSIIRFIDKLSDSENFSKSVNKTFNRIKNNQCQDNFRKVDNKESFHDFIFNYKFSEGSWEITLLNETEVFLDQLDPKLVKKILRDSNVAYLIKYSREVN